MKGKKKYAKGKNIKLPISQAVVLWGTIAVLHALSKFKDRGHNVELIKYKSSHSSDNFKKH
jgi:hypothetical protein